MSAYLSPILSSGDTTPPPQQQQQQQQQESMSNQTSHQMQQMQNSSSMSKSGNPFQSRVEISASEIAQKLRQNKLKSQQSACSNERQKTGLRATSNPMLLNEVSSSSSSSSLSAAEEAPRDELEQRAVAKALVLNCFRKRHEHELGARSDEAEEEEEEAEDEQMDDLFGQRMEKSPCRAAYRLGQSDNRQQQQATHTNSCSSSAGSHQTLAEQFLQQGAKGKPPGAGPNAFRLNYDQSKGRQFHELLASFSARSSRLMGASGGAGAERLNKKFKQILQSIPMVPTLLATTSVMTLLLLLCLLLLSDTPRATALHRDQRHEPNAQTLLQQQQQQADLKAGATAEATSLVNEPPQPAADEFKFTLLDGDLAPRAAALRLAEPSRAALQREFIKDVFLAQAALAQHGQQQQQQQQPPPRHHPPGRLPPQLARVRTSSKRNSDQRDFDSLAREQIELADEQPASSQQEPQQQPEAPAAVNLLDSLGSMLFGAAGQQQQHLAARQPAESGAEPGEQLLDQAALLLDGEPALSHTGSDLGEREPARLRSSPLELDLRPKQGPDSALAGTGAATQRPRAHHPKQQQQQYQATAVHQQQHDSTRHHANNHERPFDVALVQCNNTVEGFERFACPSPDRLGRYRCIEDRLFCDGYYDCPNGEDEDRVHCMYYRLNQNRQTNVAAGQHQHSAAVASATGNQHHIHHNQQQQLQHHMTDAMALDT